MAELKTRKNDASVRDFLGNISDKQKRNDCQALCEIMQEITGDEPKMWGENIVGFGSYHYKYASGREADWMLTGFSPRKTNITIYVMSGFDEYAAANGYDPSYLLAKLGKYSTGKSCLYIKKLSDVNLDVLRQLITTSLASIKAVHEE
jgi:hypothetical protein